MKAVSFLSWKGPSVTCGLRLLRRRVSRPPWELRWELRALPTTRPHRWCVFITLITLEVYKVLYMLPYITLPTMTCIVTCTVTAFSLPVVIHVTATSMLSREISASDFAVEHEEKTAALKSIFPSAGWKLVALFWGCVTCVVYPSNYPRRNSRLLKSTRLYSLYCQRVKNRIGDMIINWKKYGKDVKLGGHRETVKNGIPLGKWGGLASMLACRLRMFELLSPESKSPHLPLLVLSSGLLLHLLDDNVFISSRKHLIVSFHNAWGVRISVTTQYNSI